MVAIVRTAEALKEAVLRFRASGDRIAFVPTMGNLHEGHLELIRRAHERADRVIVSIFVNPTQFGPSEDFAAYPRTPAADLEKLQGVACDLLFEPAVETLYPEGLESLTKVSVPPVSEVLCGATRPGHFEGVATVVLTLFHLVDPDLAVFGEKDFQQLMVIRKMVRDLHLALEVYGVPTVREEDGLALSSRNAYLTTAQRAQAPALHRRLEAGVAAILGGERDFAALEAALAEGLSADGFAVDYVAIRRECDLASPASSDRPLRILAAARLGKTRLIDNLPV